MNILVTGGAGYIGSHACRALAAKGHVPITYDDLARGNRWAVKWGPLLEADIGDVARLRAALEQYRPAALMHFSAYAYVGESVEKPLLYYRNNFAATASLLHTLTEFGCIPVVFSSSCAVYGEPERLPHSGGASAAANQPVRALQAVRGAHAGGSFDCLWAVLDGAALFQCRGRRTPMARSGRRMTRRPTSFRWCSRPPAMACRC